MISGNFNISVDPRGFLHYRRSTVN